MLRTVTLLGATGSIGRSTRDVIAENPDRLAIWPSSAARMRRRWRKVAIETGARFAALADEGGAAALAEALSGSGIAHGAGQSAVLDAVAMPQRYRRQRDFRSGGAGGDLCRTDARTGRSRSPTRKAWSAPAPP
jgi:hypothetical protein